MQKLSNKWMFKYHFSIEKYAIQRSIKKLVILICTLVAFLVVVMVLGHAIMLFICCHVENIIG